MDASKRNHVNQDQLSTGQVRQRQKPSPQHQEPRTGGMNIIVNYHDHKYWKTLAMTLNRNRLLDKENYVRCKEWIVADFKFTFNDLSLRWRCLNCSIEASALLIRMRGTKPYPLRTLLSSVKLQLRIVMQLFICTLDECCSYLAT